MESSYSVNDVSGESTSTKRSSINLHIYQRLSKRRKQTRNSNAEYKCS